MNQQQSIQLINQVFFDSFAELAEETPEFIEEYQEAIWRETVAFAVRRLRADGRRIVALEIGAGKGFATTAVYDQLGADDVLVCNDISASMLEGCKLKIADLSARRGAGQPAVSFRSGSFDSIAVEQRFNLIYMNSVAHHMPDLRAFFARIDAQLEPGGLLVLGREPNHDFWNHWFLFPVNLWASRAVRLAHLVKSALGQTQVPDGQSAEARAALVATARLRERGVTRVGAVEITPATIGSFVDIQAPQGATEQEKQKGLGVRQLIERILPARYQSLFVRTYSHLGTIETEGLTRSMDRLIGKVFPDKGMHLLCVLRKG